MNNCTYYFEHVTDRQFMTIARGMKAAVNKLPEVRAKIAKHTNLPDGSKYKLYCIVHTCPETGKIEYYKGELFNTTRSKVRIDLSNAIEYKEA